MKTSNVELNPNKLVQYLNKPASEFTKDDIIRFIKENGIKMLNFRYVGGDGRLKALTFVIRDEEHLDNLLSAGERVDGSSLFSYIEADTSDLYVLPKYRTAFVNPFEEIPTVDILCSYFDKDGTPLISASETIMKKASQVLTEKTGYELQAMGELEYYIIANSGEVNMGFPAVDQRGYHESNPFTKYDQLRKEAMMYIAEAGGKIKYGHSEVGNFTDNNYYYEQNEIEFETDTLENSADRLLIAKWMLRMLADQYGVVISFAPKITVGKAGSGLHVHMKLLKDGKSIMVENGDISDAAKRAMAGLLDVAAGITAFGNRVPTSYLRLVPHQEAPTNICWGDRNRSALIRVPLGWFSDDCSKMIAHVNPNYCEDFKSHSYKSTFEFRAADPSADLYLLFAAFAVGIRHGFEMDNALEIAKNLYIDVNIFKDEHKDRLAQLEHLPASCYESAQALKKYKDIFTQYDVFTEGMIDDTVKYLESLDDYQLSERLYGKNEEIKKLVDSYIHIA
ncbi:TPA: glutamine synthetase [Methanosarcina acetivorans]|jgi:glutamine synthetase|uniref:Glutamate-ammonia ligase n=2 Tax=Methanosarcina acetivorans TaxID=2214 RepID=Q8TKM1_METAC|nr:glutamine synthetase family protein [Methanosarcina acetivorans]AAM06751.1 glutamate-ammonia ligase [Methanosarcina acetivorans C2A]HIH94265.1 glutamine synthetase [Methanosarcina acetivorans]